MSTATYTDVPVVIVCGASQIVDHRLGRIADYQIRMSFSTRIPLSAAQPTALRWRRNNNNKKTANKGDGTFIAEYRGL